MNKVDKAVEWKKNCGNKGNECVFRVAFFRFFFDKSNRDCFKQEWSKQKKCKCICRFRNCKLSGEANRKVFKRFFRVFKSVSIQHWRVFWKSFHFYMLNQILSLVQLAIICHFHISRLSIHDVQNWLPHGCVSGVRYCSHMNKWRIPTSQQQQLGIQQFQY